MKKTIFGTSGYEQAVKTLLVGVAGDTAKVKMVNSAGGHIYSSKCTEVENIYGRFNVTIFKKDGKIIGKEVYSYDSDQVTEYIYDRLEKKFIKIEEENQKEGEATPSDDDIADAGIKQMESHEDGVQ